MILLEIEEVAFDKISFAAEAGIVYLV